MRVVSSQSEKRETAAAVKVEVRELAANLLRIIRGARKPHNLWRQMRSCLTAAEDYYKAHGQLPSNPTLHQVLDIDAARDEFRPWIQRSRKGIHPTKRERIEQKIFEASLQIVASTLIDQHTQVGVAHGALYEAIRELEAVREEKQR